MNELSVCRLAGRQWRVAHRRFANTNIVMATIATPTITLMTTIITTFTCGQQLSTLFSTPTILTLYCFLAILFANTFLFAFQIFTTPASVSISSNTLIFDSRL